MVASLETFSSAGASAKSLLLISGKGRSGSNRLLDILDKSQQTICRNEAYSTVGSEFNNLDAKLFVEDLDAERLMALRRSIARAFFRRGNKDRFDQPNKIFLTKPGKMILSHMSKTRLRKFLSTMAIMKHHGEWNIPDFFLDGSAISRATLVIKLNACPAWTTALIDVDPTCRVVHNIRHPFDYLQSWYNRFIRKRAESYQSFERNFDDVVRILVYFGRSDIERLRPPTIENVVEAEVWRWRFINERLMTLSSLPSRYLLMTYEEVEGKSVEAAKRLFDFADLPYDRSTAAQVGSMRNTLFSKPHATALDAALCRKLIDEVLEDSPLRDIFDDNRSRTVGQ